MIVIKMAFCNEKCLNFKLRTYSAILLFRYSAIPLFRYSIIPLFRILFRIPGLVSPMLARQSLFSFTYYHNGGSIATS